MKKQVNKSNRVRTIDAFSLVLVLITDYYNFLILLYYYYNGSDSYTFLFKTLTYLNFGQKRHLNMISTCVRRMDGQTDGRMDGQTNGQTDILTDRSTDGHSLL